MFIITILLLCIAFNVSLELSIGKELALIVKDVLSESSPATICEICILHNKHAPEWLDLVNEFMHQLGFQLCLVIQLEELTLAVRLCELYLVYLDAKFDHLEDFVKNKLQSPKWNRFAKFVFVTHHLGSLSEVQSTWYFYGLVVHHLSITNSVLLVLPYEKKMVLSYNLFSQNLFPCKFNEIGHVLVQNNLLDVNGFLFKVLLYDITLYLQVINPKRAAGPYWQLVRAFTKHINASLRVAAVSNRPSHKVLFNQVPVSIVFNYYHGLSEFVSAHSLQSFCLTLPENRLGSFFNNLLYPFTTELWFLVMFIFLVSVTLHNFFP